VVARDHSGDRPWTILHVGPPNDVDLDNALSHCFAALEERVILLKADSLDGAQAVISSGINHLDAVILYDRAEPLCPLLRQQCPNSVPVHLVHQKDQPELRQHIIDEHTHRGQQKALVIGSELGGTFVEKRKRLAAELQKWLYSAWVERMLKQLSVRPLRDLERQVVALRIARYRPYLDDTAVQAVRLHCDIEGRHVYWK
jgi:hypothetical protein